MQGHQLLGACATEAAAGLFRPGVIDEPPDQYLRNVDRDAVVTVLLLMNMEVIVAEAQMFLRPIVARRVAVVLLGLVSH